MAPTNKLIVLNWLYFRRSLKEQLQPTFHVKLVHYDNFGKNLGRLTIRTKQNGNLDLKLLWHILWNVNTIMSVLSPT